MPRICCPPRRIGNDIDFDPGTVIPANGIIYIANNRADFRARQTSPTAGEDLIVGDYKRNLDNEAGRVELFNPNGDLIDTQDHQTP